MYLNYLIFHPQTYLPTVMGSIVPLPPHPQLQFIWRRLNLWYFWMWLYLEIGLLRHCCSVAQSCLTVCDPMDCSTPGFLYFTISQTLLKLKSIDLVMLSNHLILCHPLLLLLSIFPSIRVFSKELAPCIRWPKYWSFSFSVSPSNESSRTDFLYNLLVSSCSPRDSQESSPTPQFKRINSLVLSFLYGPTLTSIHDYWKNYSFD